MIKQIRNLIQTFSDQTVFSTIFLRSFILDQTEKRHFEHVKAPFTFHQITTSTVATSLTNHTIDDSLLVIFSILSLTPRQSIHHPPNHITASLSPLYFLGSGPKGSMSCRTLGGISRRLSFRPSFRPSPPLGYRGPKFCSLRPDFDPLSHQNRLNSPFRPQFSP